MSLFVPLYGPFRAYLKRALFVSAHGPRLRPKPGPIYRSARFIQNIYEHIEKYNL
jgi:hypothetical protein